MIAAEEPSIDELLCGYRDGTINPEEVVERAYALAAASEQPAWISLVPRNLLANLLAELRRMPRDLPLYGIPFAIKDNIDLAGVPTTGACRGVDAPAAVDAFVVARLIAAGAVPIGKTNMDQLATGLAGTRSPFGACASVHDPRSISGGSSSGSAVVVADGTVPFALATDTAGSGRVPAALNGIVGFKPSRGRLSTSGVMPACRSLDCVSVLARSVADAELVVGVAEAFDPADPYSRSFGAATPPHAPARVGVPDPVPAALDDAAAAAWQSALAQAREHGWELVGFDLEPFLDAGRLLYGGAWVAERMLALGGRLADPTAAIDPAVRAVVERGSEFSAVEAFAAVHRLAELSRAVEPLLSELDALLLPTVGTTFTHDEIAFDPVGRNALLGTFTTFANLLDLAVVAVPAGERGDGLPFGVSLLGPSGSDLRLTALARRWTGEKAPAAGFSSAGAVPLAVVGAHLSGQPLNHQIVDLGARLCETTRTAPDYRLYALAGDGPARPGLVRDPTFDGDGIEVEIWELTPEAIGRLLVGVPAPLAIGSVELVDGRVVTGFVCEGSGILDALEITGFGGWRAYRASDSVLRAAR